MEAEQQRVLIESRSAIERANQSVVKSQAIAIETEQIGAEVISELGEQRETLLRAKNRLVHTNEELNKAKRIIRTMKRKVLTNKIVLILIILLEITILGLVVFIKYIKK